MVLNSRQAITWTNDDPVHWCICMSPGLNVLVSCGYIFCPFFYQHWHKTQPEWERCEHCRVQWLHPAFHCWAWRLRSAHARRENWWDVQAGGCSEKQSFCGGHSCGYSSSGAASTCGHTSLCSKVGNHWNDVKIDKMLNWLSVAPFIVFLTQWGLYKMYCLKSKRAVNCNVKKFGWWNFRFWNQKLFSKYPKDQAGVEHFHRPS